MQARSDPRPPPADTTLRGLSSAEAAARLARDGPNELARDRPRSLLAVLLGVVREPMLLLLLGGGAVYFLLGDVEEGVVLLSFVLVVLGITFVQERKTERALSALRDLTSPRALVIRDGARSRIAGREVVEGDILVLAEGDRIAADARLVEADVLEVDESLLTGESVPVQKVVTSEPPTDPRPGGDAQPFVYAGTLIVRGHGLAEVRATGARTAMGRIGTALATVETRRSPLQEEVAALVKTVAIAAVAICTVLVIVYGATRGNWLEALLGGIALAMAMLPEEFPVVLTVFMALGAWRLSRGAVLTRRLPAVEALGSATVLCTDKTGTLTRNEMSVARLWANGAMHAVADGVLPEAFHEVVEVGILASQSDPFDPMEIAFTRLGERALAGTEHLHTTWTLVRAYPLSPALLAMSHVWRAPDGERLVVAAKGAPEAIADICHLDDAKAAEVRAAVEAMARDGLRVLAVARAPFERGELPPGQHDFAFELVGLVGLADPVRPGVPAAVAECGRAGVRVLMITGDSPVTASAIGRTIGLPPDAVLTGPQLEAVPDDALPALLRRTSICARVAPEQKLRIVEALRADGDVVAMTGDGVNDAPALKAAHIGVAMGGRGSDVAREAAAIVVTDDDFSSIVRAVRLGRRIYDNLQRAMAYVVAVHVPIAGMALLPVLLGWPLILFPVHIVFLELIIDPACSIAFEAEPEDPRVMDRPPRSAGARLLPARVVVLALLQGVSVLVATVIAFRVGVAHTGSEAASRTVALAALIAGNVGLILVNRSWGRTVVGALRNRNRAAWIVIVGASLAFLATVAAPPLRSVFRYGPVALHDVALAAVLGVGSLAWFEIVKRVAPAWVGGAVRAPRRS